jgi:hypothetical protein
MAAITHRGITYTTSAGTPAMVLDMAMNTGVDIDDTTWLTSYPGALTSFAARQTDGSNARAPRFVLLTWTGATAAATLTLSGEVTAVHGAFSEIGSAGDSGVSKSGLVLTHNSSATETLTLLLVLG